jgi:hypothetical protein
VVQIAEKFEHFLEVYRRQDGSRWGGQDLHDATAGVVTLSYISSLENPGFEKLRTKVKAMNFPLNVRRLERGGYNRLGVPTQGSPPRGPIL